MINIDLTTKNTVYNTLGPQAQWIQHRFGRRDYPNVELDFSILSETIMSTNDTINLVSIYGDPCCYSKIKDLLEIISPGRIVINTYLNFNDDELISLINASGAYVVVPLSGVDELCNKIVLHSSWTQISHNLKLLTCGVQLEFYVYEHNTSQVEYIKDFCRTHNVELILKPGISIHPDGFSPVVDEQGEWLYDVRPTNNFNVTKQLSKTVDGYNSLIQYVRSVKGKAINNSPIIYNVSHNYLFNNDSMCISVTGHKLKSVEKLHAFSNALCTDWNLSYSNILDHHKQIRADFKYNCALLREILTDLADSNV